jgi:hypothetical protein
MRYVFFFLAEYESTSTSDIMALAVISSNIIFQEEGHIENSPISLSWRGQALYAFR